MSHSAKGLTLIELVTALAIVSIITTLVIYNFASQSPHRQLKEATQTLISQFQLARQKAITEGKTVTLFFDAGTNQYTGVLGQQTLPHHIVFDNAIDQNKPSHGIDFDDNKVVFQPNGTVQPMGSIYLKNSRNEAVKVVLNITGRITQEWWNGRKWEKK